MSTGFDVNLMKRSRPNNLVIINRYGVRINRKGLRELLQSEFNAGRVEIISLRKSNLAIRTDHLGIEEVLTAVQMATGATRQELQRTA